MWISSNYIKSLIPPSSEELCWVSASVEKGHELRTGNHVVCQGTHGSTRAQATERKYDELHAYVCQGWIEVLFNLENFQFHTLKQIQKFLHQLRTFYIKDNLMMKQWI